MEGDGVHRRIDRKQHGSLCGREGNRHVPAGLPDGGKLDCVLLDPGVAVSTTNLPHYTDREHPRHPTPMAGNEAIKASVEIESIEIHGILANISRFGACVTISQELALMALPRTVLTLRATLGTETVSMTADLCWIHNEVGKTTIGMSFPYGPLEGGTFLDAYMEGAPAVAV